MEQIAEIKKKLKKNEITFEKIYEELKDSSKFKYKYSTSLINDKKLKEKGIITEDHRDKLFDLILDDGNECIKFLNKYVCDNKYEEKLLNKAIETGNKDTLQLLCNFRYLLYVIRNISTEDRLFNSITLNNIRNSIYSETDTYSKKLLITSVVENIDLIKQLMLWYNIQSIMTDEEKYRMYEKYKEEMFSNRLSVPRLYSNIAIMNKFTEYIYIDRLVDKIIRTKQTGYMNNLIDSMYKFKLSEEEIEKINAKIILFKITE